MGDSVEQFARVQNCDDRSGRESVTTENTLGKEGCSPRETAHCPVSVQVKEGEVLRKSDTDGSGKERGRTHQLSSNIGSRRGDDTEEKQRAVGVGG